LHFYVNSGKKILQLDLIIAKINSKMDIIVRRMLAKELPYKEWQKGFDKNDLVEVVIRPETKRDIEVDREFENGEYTSFDNAEDAINWLNFKKCLI